LGAWVVELTETGLWWSGFFVITGFAVGKFFL